MLCGVATEHLRVGQLDKARNKAQEALVLNPKYSSARLLLGKVFLEQGHYVQAVKHLELVVRDNPRSAEALYLLGVAQEKGGQLEEALDSYRQSHALDGSNLAGVTAAGEMLAEMGRVEEAQVYVEGYLDDASSEPALCELAGRLAMMRQQYEKAATHFRYAYDLDSRNTCYAESLGRAQFLAGQHTEAAETLEGLTQVGAERPGAAQADQDYSAPAWVHTMVGDCHMIAGRFYDARDAYYAAMRLKEDDSGAWVNLGKAALALGDSARAVLSAREALRLEPRSLDAALVLGYALLCDGRNEAAVTELRSAAAIHPDSGTLQCLLGKAHAAAGGDEDAVRCYQSALRLEPDNKLARALLQRQRLHATDRRLHD